jgi:hypothetical protein
MSKSKLWKSVGFVFFYVLSLNVSASFHCNVDVINVLIYSNGNVNVKHTGRGDYTVICNLKQERQGVSIATCALWASILSGYEKENKKATFYYNTAPDYSSCAELPIYNSAPAPVYIGNGD